MPRLQSHDLHLSVPREPAANMGGMRTASDVELCFLNLFWHQITWPHLERIRLEKIRGGKKDFRAFRSKHSSTLKQLRLYRMNWAKDWLTDLCKEVIPDLDLTWEVKLWDS